MSRSNESAQTKKKDKKPTKPIDPLWYCVLIVVFCYAALWLSLPGLDQANHAPHQAVSHFVAQTPQGDRQGEPPARAQAEVAVDPSRPQFPRSAYWNAFLDEMSEGGARRPLPTYKDDPDFSERHPINNKTIGTQLIPLYKPWGHVYSNKIFCMVPTLWPDRKPKMDMIASTYGPGCDELVWVVDEASKPPATYAGHKFFVIALTRPQQNGANRNIWEKIHTMYAALYNRQLFKEFDWFIKADDDTFIFTENMKGFLQYYDPNFPHYLGHTIRSRWKPENIVFNSGACYVISRKVIEKIGPYLARLPTVDHNTGRSHCMDRVGAGEDPTTAICLGGVGIRAGNTLDHEMRERFLIFKPPDHENIIREDTWYWKYKPNNIKRGKGCNSPYIVATHTYKFMVDMKKWFPIFQNEWNQPKDWTQIPLPPRPRVFLYEGLDFKMDEWRNSENTPRGQRVFLNSSNYWQCWKCNIGDPKDPYWTEWWDKPQDTT